MATTSTVRVSEHAHDVLRRISEQEGISMIEALDKITADWERMQFFQSLNDSYAALRSDSDAWQEELEERRLWDRTLKDDLEHEPSKEAEPG